MERCYLAVDIGASSGRHILGRIRNGRMEIEEIYRFPNGLEEKDGTLCWNLEELFKEVLAGMKECGKRGFQPESMAVDTWAVDFVLLDKLGRILGKTAGYRDGRTAGMDEKVSRIVSPKELYRRTGIQKQIFNTIYQLMAVKEQEPGLLEKAEHLLMIPDYLNYLLTGKLHQEYTNATTTQMVSPESRDWDRDLIGRLGFPQKLFAPLSDPGLEVGRLKKEIAEETGLDCRVVLAASHDTASAVAAVPAGEEHFLYISSGTWSLMGTERKEADCTEGSFRANVTNEGGYGGTYRYLKNIMGLWMIQSVKKEWEAEGESYSFDEICKNASKERISSIVDCNDSRFLAPASMSREIENYCRETGQPVPQNKWEMAAVIYNSLAACYRDCCRQIERLTGRNYNAIYIVGGGSNADYLNRLTARACQKNVYAGLGEATAVGNLAVQMIAGGEFAGLREARQTIGRSFPMAVYETD